MLFVMAILALVGRLPVDPWFAFPSFFIAFGLVTAGLLSSLLHLGHPERFLKALTQWRSSWLSREGVLAIITYGPAGLFTLGWLFIVEEPAAPGFVITLLAVVTALLCVATVFSTSMIYASLKPIPQWYRQHVPEGYLALSLATGALIVNALGALTGSTTHLVPTIASVAVLAAFFVKARYWRGLENTTPLMTAASATGLDAGVRVRSLDLPHTEPNYLQKEMGFRVARKHARKLRQVFYMTGLGVPLLALVISFSVDGHLNSALAIVAALSGHFGVAVERWLFSLRPLTQ